MANAKTNQGEVVGREKDGVLLFAGIPYVAPPTGPRRFRPPQPHEAWSTPRDARKFGPAAPQVSSGGLTDPAPVRWNEDCLTLNVQTPALDDAGRPVLVWIHGGAYRTGQGSIPWYNGARFCLNGDIVVVTINYRLGALGFTDLSSLDSEFSTSGALGTLDQIAALEWVRDNISNFGGDPGKVTIAGESAGGFSVTTLLGCGAAQPLFRAAIPQSGAAYNTLPKRLGEQVGEAFLRELAVDSPMGLESVSVEAILNAQSAVIAELEGGAGFQNRLGSFVSPFYPVHGGEVLPLSTREAIAQGIGADKPVLTGSNADETTLWGYGEVDDNKLARAVDSFGAAKPLSVYQQQEPEADAERLLIRMTTDHMFRIPAVRLAEARNNHGADTWVYLFAWKSRAFSGKLGATHALEIPFAFDNLHQPGVDAFLGPGAQPQQVAQAMHSAWTQFVRDGHPGWDAYHLERRATYVFDETSRQEDDPDGVSRAAWDGIR